MSDADPPAEAPKTEAAPAGVDAGLTPEEKKEMDKIVDETEDVPLDPAKPEPEADGKAKPAAAPPAEEKKKESKVKDTQPGMLCCTIV